MYSYMHDSQIEDIIFDWRPNLEDWSAYYIIYRYLLQGTAVTAGCSIYTTS